MLNPCLSAHTLVKWSLMVKVDSDLIGNLNLDIFISRKESPDSVEVVDSFFHVRQLLSDNLPIFIPQNVQVFIAKNISKCKNILIVLHNFIAGCTICLGHYIVTYYIKWVKTFFMFEQLLSTYIVYIPHII